MRERQITLDETDWKILETLQDNARSTFTEIGQIVGLTAPAVRERIRRMEDEELIAGYRPVINYNVLGRPLHALISLKYKSASRAAERSELSQLGLFKDIPGVLRSWLVTGDTECVIEAVTATMKELDAILVELNRLGFLTVTYMVLEDTGERNCRKL